MLKKGVGCREVLQAAWLGITRTKEVVWILVLVGIIIPAWMASGTIPYMIELGLSLVNPVYFLVSAFLMTSIISLILGTSLGSLSAVGIPLMGVASYLRIPLPLVAGALVSGAFVGDRTSPLSSANRLVAMSVGLSGRETMTALTPTTISALIVTGGYFFVADVHGNWQSLSLISSYQPFSTWFILGPWLLAPLVVLIAGLLLRFKTQYVFTGAIISSIVVGTGYQNIAPLDWLNYLFFGFNITGVAILNAKGLLAMSGLIMFIVLAGAFNGMLDSIGGIKPYIRLVLGANSSLTMATARAVLFGAAITAVACNQTLPIMLQGGSLATVWREKFSAKHLVRIVADSSVVFAGLVPWNLLAVLCASILQIRVTEYLAYAIFLWMMPLLTIFYSFACRKLGENSG
jgi:NhaC family Na+:H+ antiporter